MQYPPQTTRKNISGIVKELTVLLRQGQGRGKISLRGHSPDLSEFWQDRLWVSDIEIIQCPHDEWFSIVTATCNKKAENFDVWNGCQLIFRLPTKQITY